MRSLVLLLGACAAAPVAAPARPAHRDPVVKVLGAGHDGARVRLTRGTGFVVDDGGHVVTAHHAVDLRGFARVELSVILDPGTDLETRYPARVVAFDAGGDLALLRLEPAPNGPPPLRVASNGLREGQRVTVRGYPGAGDLAEREGVVAGFFPADRTGVRKARVRGAVEVARGNSGSPLLAENGEVLGVVVEKGPQGAYAVPAPYLRRRLVQWTASP